MGTADKGIERLGVGVGGYNWLVLEALGTERLEPFHLLIPSGATTQSGVWLREAC